MKAALKHLVDQAIGELREAGGVRSRLAARGPIERARNPEHGDFASPVALGLARSLKRKPREIADAIVSHLPADPGVAAVELAGPGFINFRLAAAAYHDVVRDILARGAEYGRGTAGRGVSVQVEFVSANPDRPTARRPRAWRGLRRYGCQPARSRAGCEVQREYYVNDAGRQMDILATQRMAALPGRCAARRRPFPRQAPIRAPTSWTRPGPCVNGQSW